MKKLGLLAFSALLAIGAAITLASSKNEPRRSGFGDLARAKIAFAEREFARAEDLLRGLAGDDARLLLARVLRERGRLAASRDLFAALLKENPASVEAARGMADVSSALGLHDLAVVYATRAADLLKDSPAAWRDLAVIQHRKGDSAGALASIQRSLDLDAAQEDLVQLMTELLTAQNPGNDAAARRGPQAPFTAPHPKTLVPRPPDPNSMFPRPDGRRNP